jgi:hypothetical protein
MRIARASSRLSIEACGPAVRRPTQSLCSWEPSEDRQEVCELRNWKYLGRASNAIHEPRYWLIVACLLYSSAAVAETDRKKCMDECSLHYNLCYVAAEAVEPVDLDLWTRRGLSECAIAGNCEPPGAKKAQAEAACTNTRNACEHDCLLKSDAEWYEPWRRWR